MCIIIHQILTLKTSLILRKNLLQDHNFFLVIDATSEDNPSHFKKNLLEGLIMTTDDKIRDEKLQYDISKKQEKYLHYHLEKLTNMNIL